MISLLEARALALSVIEPAAPLRLPLLTAVGCFLSEPVKATRSLPSCDNAAMDGYAVKSSETRGANRDRPARFEVMETVYAGGLPTHFVSSMEAVRIFTGAPMPTGADCVVRQEAARAHGQHVEIVAESAPGSNIRRRGEEVALGAPLFEPGLRLSAYSIGVLASLGQATAPVRSRPRVAVLTVGDELVSPGEPAAVHQVYDSNSSVLAALAQDAGAEVISVAHLADDDEALRAAFEARLEKAEMIVTSGGASVGDKDRVKRVITSMGGQLIFDGVALKPGKPVGVARLSGRPVVVLPGNPGAACVAFDQIARPMLFKRQGVLERRRKVRVQLITAKTKQPSLTYLLSAHVERERHGPPRARIRPQGAGQLLQNVGAEGWVILPAGQPRFEAGEEVEMELFLDPTFEPTGRP